MLCTHQVIGSNPITSNRKAPAWVGPHRVDDQQSRLMLELQPCEIAIPQDLDAETEE